jgi:hypothetical protein
MSEDVRPLVEVEVELRAALADAEMIPLFLSEKLVRHALLALQVAAMTQDNHQAAGLLADVIDGRYPLGVSSAVVGGRDAVALKLWETGRVVVWWDWATIEEGEAIMGRAPDEDPRAGHGYA